MILKTVSSFTAFHAKDPHDMWRRLAATSLEAKREALLDVPGVEADLPPVDNPEVGTYVTWAPGFGPPGDFLPSGAVTPDVGVMLAVDLWRRRVPPALVKARCAAAEAKWLLDTGAARMPASLRKEVREEVEAHLAAMTPRAPTRVDIFLDPLSDGRVRVLIGATSDAVLTGVRPIVSALLGSSLEVDRPGLRAGSSAAAAHSTLSRGSVRVDDAIEFFGGTAISLRREGEAARYSGDAAWENAAALVEDGWTVDGFRSEYTLSDEFHGYVDVNGSGDIVRAKVPPWESWEAAVHTLGKIGDAWVEVLRS